ncbi:hypothetical protein ABZ348_30395 [Streptomyces sp. NPDC005963]|uniref:hypothetical protein n=1 Tax=Streptomyces sp. NPDC005963 TaxID=3156721 RepID=UPI0033E5696F
MTLPSHEPVMELLRAAIDPVSHRTAASSPADLPTGRLIAATAYADADDTGMTRLSLLGAGTAMAAFGLTLEIAARNEQDPGAFLDSLAEASQTRGDREFPLAVDVIRRMLSDGFADGAEILGTTFARSEQESLTLLLHLANYCGTTIQLLETRFGTPMEDTLQDLSNALQDTDTPA